ncbi:hypothetical protein JHK86_010176 [Glycine max]|nr:hypothetical protein JHK86_010176 [Glycine max]
MYHIEFDEFKEELMRRHWDEELTSFDEGSIDVAIVKEFYANLYDLEDKLPKQLQVRGHLIKFDEDTLNTFRKTAMIVEEGENLCAYSRFALLRPNPQELAAKLCIPGRGFELNEDPSKSSSSDSHWWVHFRLTVRALFFLSIATLPRYFSSKLCCYIEYLGLFGELVVNPRTFFGFCCKDWGSCGDLRYVLCRGHWYSQALISIEVFDLGNQIELPGRKLTVDSR